MLLWCDCSPGQRERWQLAPQPRGSSPGGNLLQESLVLLYWLLQNHGSFSESVQAMLHIYDQVFPALRDNLKTLPDLTYSQGYTVRSDSRPFALIFSADLTLTAQVLHFLYLFY